MGSCFVIQPFDRGPFDKRYEDVLAPAIRDAGLEPYRVDQDVAATVLIESIEQGIRAAVVCVADITLDNANVWYELGYAFASGKDVILLCHQERGKFPFDVQHRNILVYSTESASDFARLRKALTDRIRAALEKNREFAVLASPVRESEGGLAPHEVTCLAVIMENTLGSPMTYIHHIQRDMDRAGFTTTATAVAIRSLAKKKLVSVEVERDQNGDPYQAYFLTQEGEDWLVEHQSELTLRNESGSPPGQPDGSDDIPF